MIIYFVEENYQSLQTLDRLPWISHVGLLSQPDSVQFMVVLPFRSYPGLQLIMADCPSVVPEVTTAIPLEGAASPQSERKSCHLSTINDGKFLVLYSAP